MLQPVTCMQVSCGQGKGQNGGHQGNLKMREYHEQVKHLLLQTTVLPCSRFIGKNKGHEISISEKHVRLEPLLGWLSAPSSNFPKKTSVETGAVLSKASFQGSRKREGGLFAMTHTTR